MKRYFLIFVSVLAVAGITAGYSMSNGSTKLTSSQIANLDALTADEDGEAYEIVNHTEMGVWDEENNVFKKLIVVDCTGKGSTKCE